MHEDKTHKTDAVSVEHRIHKLCNSATAAFVRQDWFLFDTLAKEAESLFNQLNKIKGEAHKDEGGC